MSYEARPATREEIERFDPERRNTVRALAFYYNGELAAIGGITVEHGRLVAFSNICDNLEAPKMTIYRAARDVMKFIGNRPILASADPAFPNSGRFLESLGFTHIGTQECGEVYQWRA